MYLLCAIYNGMECSFIVFLLRVRTYIPDTYRHISEYSTRRRLLIERFPLPASCYFVLSTICRRMRERERERRYAMSTRRTWGSTWRISFRLRKLHTLGRLRETTRDLKRFVALKQCTTMIHASLNSATLPLNRRKTE